MDRIDVRDLKGKIKDDSKGVTLRIGDKMLHIMLTYQNTGFGKKRFFVCPYCSKNVQHLYIDGTDLKCRTCGGVKYTGIQNCTKGGYDEIAYKMKRYAAAHDIQFSFPFNYLDFTMDARMRKTKFRNYVKVLQALENMRFHSLFFSTQYKPNLIKSVMTGKHKIIQNVTLDELKNNIYDWETGGQIKIPESEVSGFVKSL